MEDVPKYIIQVEAPQEDQRMDQRMEDQRMDTPETPPAFPYGIPRSVPAPGPLAGSGGEPPLPPRPPGGFSGGWGGNAPTEYFSMEGADPGAEAPFYFAGSGGGGGGGGGGDDGDFGELRQDSESSWINEQISLLLTRVKALEDASQDSVRSHNALKARVDAAELRLGELDWVKAQVGDLVQARTASDKVQADLVKRLDFMTSQLDARVAPFVSEDALTFPNVERLLSEKVLALEKRCADKYYPKTSGNVLDNRLAADWTSNTRRSEELTEQLARLNSRNRRPSFPPTLLPSRRSRRRWGTRWMLDSPGLPRR